MTTGRMTTALGALALGLATAAAVPTLAQTSTSGTSQPSATTSTPPAASATPGSSTTGTATGTANTATGRTSSQPKTATTMAKTTHPMSKTHTAAGETHHVMRTRTASRANESNPNAQDAAIDRLNQESLQSAQQGKPFSPPTGKL